MKKILYNRQLEELIKILDCKLSLLPPNPLGFCPILFYPGGCEEKLSDSEFKLLVQTIEDHFEKAIPKHLYRYYVHI